MKPCLCRVGGWFMQAIPGTMFLLGGGAICWGPYTFEEAKEFPDGDFNGSAIAEIAFCSCGRQASWVSEVVNSPGLCILGNNHCPKCSDCMSQN